MGKKDEKRSSEQNEATQANINMDKKFYGDDDERGSDIMFDVGETAQSVIFDEIKNDVRQD